MSNESGYEYEIIFTDNDSKDGTQELLRNLASDDSRIKVILNSRNYGPMRSPKNALRYVSGEVVMMLAADLQDPPELMPKFLRLWEQGYKLVYGKKSASKEFFLKHKLRSLFYGIIDAFADTKQYKHISGMWLNDREALEVLLRCDEDDEYRYILPQLGFPIEFVEYTQDKRKSGKSSYNIWRSWSFVMESLVSTTTAPLRIVTFWGMIIAILSFGVGLFYLIYKLIYWNDFAVGTTPLIIALLFFGSVQLVSIGLIGEYIGAVLRKVSYRVPVMEKELINLERINQGK
jgi:glycosyltransferase involved in cell wall biosynthesis